jgi:hypothetical protein
LGKMSSHLFFTFQPTFVDYFLLIINTLIAGKLVSFEMAKTGFMCENYRVRTVKKW